MTIIVQPTASASVRDYDWLKTSIAKWLHRSDLTAIIPDFVMMAERRINGELESNKQEAVFPVDLPMHAVSVPLPDDAGEIRALSLTGGGELEYLAPAIFNAKQSQNSSGEPRVFTVIGRDLYVGPLPDADYTLMLAYRQYVPALADSAGTNWLIEQHPDIYLAASMCEAVRYTKNVADLPMWNEKYAAAMTALNKSGSFTGSSMRVRSDARIV